MNRLPDRSNLDHLKKQAKDLLRSWRNRDPQAVAQFRASLPAAAGRSDDEIAAQKLRLHDAQSCVARAYGFASWMDLRAYVEAEAGTRGDRAARTLRWASCNEPPAGGDWIGCAQALLEHGFPRAVPDPGDPDWVLIDGRRKRYSDEVREVLLTDDR